MKRRSMRREIEVKCAFETFNCRAVVSRYGIGIPGGSRLKCVQQLQELPITKHLGLSVLFCRTKDQSMNKRPGPGNLVLHCNDKQWSGETAHASAASWQVPRFFKSDVEENMPNPQNP